MRLSSICPVCMGTVTAPAYCETDYEAGVMQEWHPECKVKEDAMTANLDRALAVNRDDWQPGLEVHGYDLQRDEWRTWAVIAVDWNRGAGPVICEDMDGSGRIRHFQPWDLRKVPTSVDEIEAYLSS